jgi:hypothetical protein
MGQRLTGGVVILMLSAISRTRRSDHHSGLAGYGSDAGGHPHDNATIAFFIPRRLETFIVQVLSQDHLAEHINIVWAAS